jgi:AcrR family transcriptional regulator
VSLADNSLIPQEETYQRQMTSYRRTRSAIMDSVRRCLEIQGYTATSMIDIADTAEVSRATLYNHFRDKESVFRAFFAHELDRIFNEAKREPTRESALRVLATAMSTDPIFETSRRSDPALLTLALSAKSDPLWGRLRVELDGIFGEKSELVLTWLLGQALQPLDSEYLNAQIAHLRLL